MTWSKLLCPKDEEAGGACFAALPTPPFCVLRTERCPLLPNCSGGSGGGEAAWRPRDSKRQFLLPPLDCAMESLAKFPII